MQQKNILE
jgi:hypothetical protein